MNKEQFIEKIKEIKIKTPDELFFLEYNKVVCDILEENQELKKQLEEVEFIVGLRQKRNLISKFDKEYDEEDKKKNPNRDYAGIMPDAEEIYKRYYTMKTQQKEFMEWLEKMVKDLFQKEEYGTGATYGYILSKYKEITGDKE